VKLDLYLYVGFKVDIVSITEFKTPYPEYAEAANHILIGLTLAEGCRGFLR
jgi:hypothetical protein